VAVTVGVGVAVGVAVTVGVAVETGVANVVTGTKHGTDGPQRTVWP
jgi:hypothetical protein